MKRLLARRPVAVGHDRRCARRPIPIPPKWDDVLAEAKGETVYWNAWGGAENINAYLEWAGAELEKRYGVKLVHVKLDDTASAVAKVVAEKAAGKNEGGTRRPDLDQRREFRLDEAAAICCFRRAGRRSCPTGNMSMSTTSRRSAPTSPFPSKGWKAHGAWPSWCSSTTAAKTAAASMPKSAKELLDWAKQNPGRFTYPQPPDFIGSSFLKQVLSELVADRTRAAKAGRRGIVRAGDRAALCLSRRAQPAAVARRQDLSAELSGDEAACSPTARSTSSSPSTHRRPPAPSPRANCRTRCAPSPFPAARWPTRISSRSPTMPPPRPARWSLADFLISPEAQARKQDPKVWGDPTVLAVGKACRRRQGALRRARSRHRHAEAGRTRPGARRAASELDGAAGDRMEAALRRGELRDARDEQVCVTITPRQAMLTRLGPPLTVLLLAGPILAGLLGTILPAFGYLPALGGIDFTPRSVPSSCSPSRASRCRS